MRQKEIIECCLVEDHCDIVPFIQSLLRAKKIKNVPNRMLHFDSHPDLSLPTNQTNTHDWKDLNKLWDILNQSESGISEFVIPLVCSNIISTVTWVKPRWSSQFGVGSPQFTVGNVKYHSTTNDYDNKRVASNSCSHNTVSDNDRLVAAISTKQAYFLSDHVICDDEDMIPTDKFYIIFNVVELNSDYFTSISPLKYTSSNNNSNIDSNSDSEHWMLDICLDYFSTYNPLILELQSLLSPCLSSFDLTSMSHLLPKPLPPKTTFTVCSTPTTTAPTSTATASIDTSSVYDLPSKTDSVSGSEVTDRLIYIIRAVFKLLPTSTRFYTTDNNSIGSNDKDDIDTNRDDIHLASKRLKYNGHNYNPCTSEPVPTDQSSNKQHAAAYRAALAVIDRLFKHSLLATDDTSIYKVTDDEYLNEKDKLHKEFLGLYYYSDRPLMSFFLTHVLPYLPSAVKR